MTAIVAALFGALAAGIVQTLLSFRTRRLERQSVLRAIVSEVGSICMLVRAQGYLPDHEGLCQQIEQGTWDGTTWVIDLRSDYFSVFNALAPKLGELDAEHSGKIVQFYMMCKTLVDSVRPDGPAAGGGATEENAAAVLHTTKLLREMLETGDQVVAFSPMALSSTLFR